MQFFFKLEYIKKERKGNVNIVTFIFIDTEFILGNKNFTLKVVIYRKRTLRYVCTKKFLTNSVSLSDCSCFCSVGSPCPISLENI